MRWFKDSDRYVREDGKCYIRQREVRINGRWCWRWCVYGDVGGRYIDDVIEMFQTLRPQSWPTLMLTPPDDDLRHRSKRPKGRRGSYRKQSIIGGMKNVCKC